MITAWTRLAIADSTCYIGSETLTNSDRIRWSRYPLITEQARSPATIRLDSASRGCWGSSR